MTFVFQSIDVLDGQDLEELLQRPVNTLRHRQTVSQTCYTHSQHVSRATSYKVTLLLLIKSINGAHIFKSLCHVHFKT